VGDLVTGKVTKLASFGAFVGLENEMDGLVHISQISEARVEKIKNALEVGQEVKARVIKIDKSDRRIGLSIKAAEYTEDQLKREAEQLDQLKPGEDLVALEHAFDAAEEETPKAEAPKEEAAAEPEEKAAEAEPEEKAAEPEAEAEPEEKAAEPEAEAEPEEKAAE
jgi:small subunit ribosomal protein S1